MKKYALISVSDKNGIEQIAIELENLGYTILSTSNTAKYLRNHCREVVEVSDLTKFPEILEGRVKTLHPVIHGGILADRDKPEHMQKLKEMEIDPIDIVIVNLYPFKKVRNDVKSTHEQIIENIDIGGPTLIRAAAKNYLGVLVLTDPKDYQPTLELLKSTPQVVDEWARYLALKAFRLVSDYNAEIADYFERMGETRAFDLEIPEYYDLSIKHSQRLSYGENPHQRAGYYTDKPAGWKSLHGKDLSFNNLLDLDAALRGIRLFTDPTVMIIKHTNACGIGSGTTLSDAYRKAFNTDTMSPFGGIVVINRSLDLETAVLINRIFTEIIIAPDYDASVLDILRKKKDRRLIQYDPEILAQPSSAMELKTTYFGYLLQQWDLKIGDLKDWRVVTNRQPTQEEFDAMYFGWKTVAILKSNAIALTTDDRTLGLGIGQTSRIYSTEIALAHARQFGHDLSSAICASDGFIPFRDTIDTLYQNGIKALIQPGGSKADEEIIHACNEFDLAMVMTGLRHFKH